MPVYPKRLSGRGAAYRTGSAPPPLSHRLRVGEGGRRELCLLSTPGAQETRLWGREVEGNWGGIALWVGVGGKSMQSAWYAWEWGASRG